MKRATLITLGILIFLMGILSLIPGITMASEPILHSWVKIIVGIVATIIGLKKDEQRT